jgi:GxxExxY protein
MEPQITQNTQMDTGEDRVNLLSKLIIGCALTVLQADDIHRAQCLNYLKATGLHLCLLLNFGKPHLEIKRLILAL